MGESNPFGACKAFVARCMRLHYHLQLTQVDEVAEFMALPSELLTALRELRIYSIASELPDNILTHLRTFPQLQR